MGESFLMSALSMIVALSAVQLALPGFNMLTHKSVVLTLGPEVILTLIGIVLLTAVLAGSYPALFLSGFKPATILKGNVHGSGSEALVRKGLVILQFTLSAILIATSIVIYNQIDFIRTKNLGLNRANILSMYLRGGIQKNLDSFKAEALNQPGILGISAVTDLPFNVNNTTSDPVWPGKQDDEVIPFKVIMSDADLIPLLGMKLTEGRNFNGHSMADTSNYILNEAAVEAMGIKDPIGSPMEMWFGKGKVIGIVKDFHNQNFRSAIDPLVMAYYPSNAWRLLVKLDGTDLEASLKNLEKVYKKFDSAYPLTYSFLDQQFDSEYQSEITTGKLSTFFTLMAIFISCLGLLGLVSFTAERRSKELGIRKILGATLPNLVALLCGNFTKLIFISLIVACPAVYYITKSFLAQYTFHTDPGFSVFVMTAVGILALALLTVIFQSIKAARANPVNSLRAE